MIKQALATASIALALAGIPAQAYKVGIALPTQNEQRWYKEGPEIAKALEEAGFDTELYYAGDGDLATQQRQIARMVKEKYDALIVTPVMADGLSEALKAPLKARVPVISYDRLILNSKAVSYYVAFDSVEAGRMQGRALAWALHLDSRTKEHPASIEMFAGSPDDRNALHQWNGFMQIIGPYLDYKMLKVPSDDETLLRAQINGWNTDMALKRMYKLIGAQHYGPGKKALDGVFCASDGLADGVVTALKKTGYTKDDMPFITGMDGELSQIKGISDKERHMTILKDPRLIYPHLVATVKALSEGREPYINDDHTYNNGPKAVPAVVISPRVVDHSNYREAMIESGIFTAEQVKNGI